MLNVLIIAESFLTRLGLRQFFKDEYSAPKFGEAKTGEQGMLTFFERRWDLVILDTDLPDQSGFSVLRVICKSDVGYRRRVLMISTRANAAYAARARQLGASGYIYESLERAVLKTAVDTVLQGNKYFGAAAIYIGRSIPIRMELSPQEHRVMQQLARGKRPGEIARELNLNNKTVSTYKRRVLNKLHLESTADLVRYVIENKLA